MKFWKRIDQTHNHGHILEADKCFYAREFKKHQRGSNGDTNDLVINFKKPPNENGQFYRNRDVKRFAEELSQLFPEGTTVSITAVPSSKKKTDTAYTNRFEDCFRELLTLRPTLKVEWPIEVAETVRPAHEGGSRNPDEIRENYVWNGFRSSPPGVLVVIDDVITTGSHFRAFTDFLRENDFDGKVVGVFWARAVSPSPEDVFDFIEDEN